MSIIKKNKKVLILAVIVLIGILVAGIFAEPAANKDELSASSGVNYINSIDFNKLAKNPDAFMLDVHIPEQTHIPGTDVFIPYNEINNNLNKLPEDKNTQLLVYCRSGSMSKIAAEELVNLGYTNVYDLDGGVNAYKDSFVSIAITPDQIDLGTVIYGDIEETTYTLTNFTKEPLKITRVSTSCGCTSAEVAKKELGPYESTIVNVEFDPAVHRDDTNLGEITKTIYIDTDNPNYSRLRANINANVIKK